MNDLAVDTHHINNPFSPRRYPLRLLFLFFSTTVVKGEREDQMGVFDTCHPLDGDGHGSRRAREFPFIGVRGANDDDNLFAETLIAIKIRRGIVKKRR